jgi:hypothetical protein
LRTEVRGIVGPSGGEGAGGVVGEQGVESGDPVAPQLLVLVEQHLRSPDRLGVAPDESFPAVRVLGDQASSFQDGDVLLHRREGHVIGTCQVRHGDLADQGAPDDVAPGPVGQGPEDPVHLVVGDRVLQALIYNHWVVR